MTLLSTLVTISFASFQQLRRNDRFMRIFIILVLCVCVVTEVHCATRHVVLLSQTRLSLVVPPSSLMALKHIALCRFSHLLCEFVEILWYSYPMCVCACACVCV